MNLQTTCSYLCRVRSESTPTFIRRGFAWIFVMVARSQIWASSQKRIILGIAEASASTRTTLQSVSC